MFSSFSSFIPSVLQTNQETRSSTGPLQSAKDEKEPTRTPPVTERPTNLSEDPTTKKKDRKDKNANETFIVVRPPPSKSNHPLNLQVQLVPQTSRSDRPSSAVSLLDTSADAPEPADSSSILTRTTSGTSQVSAHSSSGYTSAASISSFASSTSSSGRRMIIPLYNLQAHNVMTNTIVDAGTDAKVAKFLKRGLEIIDLAMLEPVEVWGVNPLPAALPGGGSARTSVDDGHRDFASLPKPKAETSRRPTTPDNRSHLLGNALTINRELLKKASASVIPRPPAIAITEGTNPQSTGKKFLGIGRMFKKRDAPGRPVSVADPAPSFTTPTSRTLHIRTPSNSQLSQLAAPHAEAPLLTEKIPNSSPVLCPPVLGIQPLLYPPVIPPKGRPTLYVWVVRKWLKGTDNGLLNGMMGKLNSLNSGRNESHPNYIPASVTQVEVRFEWSRGKSGRKKGRGRRKGSVPRTVHGVSPSRRPSLSLEPTSHNGHADTHRESSISHYSTSTETGTSDEHGGSTPPHDDDSGDESDPEDSETPWSCVVSVQRIGLTSHLGRSGSANSASIARDYGYAPSERDHVRLKVATLSPTPHHPKVVAQLKMPFPLPDIEIEKLAVHKRVVTPHGVNRMEPSPGELVLTAEEIKDSVSSTALWLVVREGFGGVGKVNRKGDGWRIRA